MVKPSFEQMGLFMLIANEREDLVTNWSSAQQNEKVVETTVQQLHDHWIHLCNQFDPDGEYGKHYVESILNQFKPQGTTNE